VLLFCFSFQDEQHGTRSLNLKWGKHFFFVGTSTTTAAMNSQVQPRKRKQREITKEKKYLR
jgi:hypothetical protein